jgi:AdoMet-dependent heme synthase
MPMAPYSAADFDHSPMLVFYEMTQACDLRCQHCRASAQPDCHPEELSPGQSRELVRELTRFARVPLLVLTGGDPLKRWDALGLVRYAVWEGVTVAMTPSATPLLTTDAIGELQRAGLARLAVSLDGANAFTHDTFRGVEGSYQRTLDAIRFARDAGLSVQVNTTVARHNVEQIGAIAELLAPMDIALWSVFFLIPTGRAQAEHRLSAEECEEVFAALQDQSLRRPYAIKCTEAPHYRRFLLQQAKAGAVRTSARGPRPVGTNDGRGVMFVGHTGEIYPSGFLPIRCGRFPQNSLVDVYRDSETFRRLRDADQLQGKCGRCEFRNVCGGSRARAYALTGNAMAEEPDCAYVPARDAVGHSPRVALVR